MYRVWDDLVAAHDGLALALAIFVGLGGAAFAMWQAYEDTSERAALVRRLLPAGAAVAVAGLAAHLLILFGHHPASPFAVDVIYTAIAFVVGLSGAVIGFSLSASQRLRPLTAAAGAGAVVGAALFALAYLGMLALAFDAPVRFDPLLVFTAATVAVAISVAAMLLRISGLPFAHWAAAAALAAALIIPRLMLAAAIRVSPFAEVAFPTSGNNVLGEALLLMTALIMAAALTVELLVMDRVGRLNRELSQKNAALEAFDADLRLRTAQLDAQNERLRVQQEEQRDLAQVYATAFDNIPHGVAMFDRLGHLMLCNRRYRDIHALPDDLAKPGTSYRAMLEHRREAGEFAGTRPTYNELVHRIEQRRDFSYSLHQLDGRYFDVSVRFTPQSTVTLTADVTELRDSMAKVAHLALHDSLTGLPNLKLFVQQTDDALARMRRNGTRAATFCLDLDQFAAVNDALGFAFGDKVIQLVAERLRGLMRETDTIARISGDGFAILADSLAQEQDATILGQRLLDILGVPYLIEGQQVTVTASIGIALAPADATETDQLIRNAQMAMKRAKQQGRNSFQFFEQSMDARMRERRQLEADLRTAITRGEFELYYQPQLNLGRGRITGLEALIRWHHPLKGEVSPAAFVPFAEEVGLITPIGRWVIREACGAAAAWPGDIRVAVNISSVQMRDPELVATVVGALRNSGLPPERLELEITESVLLDNDAGILERLTELRSLGVRIALDDFGTGYSSLSYLQTFPFDRLKIDRAFVREINHNPDAQCIVRALATMAAGLRMETTVEGVETAEQLDNVRQQQCTEVQGFFIARPMPGSSVSRYLHEFTAAPLRLSEVQAA